MGNFGLEESQIDFIKNILQKYVKNSDAKFYIFGSRAKGCFKEYSDVDIAIDSNDFDDDIKLKIEAEFENSTFPYEVDVINLKTVSDNFKIYIAETLKQI